MIDSVLEFWQNDPNKLDSTSNATAYLQNCFMHLQDSNCLGSLGQPLGPTLNSIFGGFNSDDYLQATALIVTFYMSGDASLKEYVIAWEQEFLSIASASYSPIQVNYAAEVLYLILLTTCQCSLENELTNISTFQYTDFLIVYGVMILYSTLTLGEVIPIKSFPTFFVNTKFILSVGSIITIMFSMIISIGLCSAAGLQLNFLIIEVVPFLLLVLGMDNIFTLVNSYHNIGSTAYMAPGKLLTSYDSS